MINDEDDNLFIVKENFFVLKFYCNLCKVKEMYFFDNEICWVSKWYKIVLFKIVCVNNENLKKKIMIIGF